MSVNELPLETTSIDELIPIGQTLTWYNKTLPSDKYVFNIGQEFDVLVYEKLAKVYPDGILPDPRYDFIRYVPKEELSNTKVEQSVQPLSFIGNPHAHTFTYTAIVSGYAIGKSQGTFIASNKTGTTTSATVSGKIGGTGKITAPSHTTAYAIMRIK